MTSNVSHATIRIASDDPVHTSVSEDGVYLFVGSAQLCFGHEQAALDAIDHLVGALRDLRTDVDRERILGLIDQVNAMTRAVEAEKQLPPLTPDPGDTFAGMTR